MDTPHRAKHPGTFKILANSNLSDNFKGPTLGPHHIVQGTVADICYECGCHGYVYVFLLRTPPRSAQILIFKKKGLHAMILSRFSERQRWASRSYFWLPELGFQNRSQQTPELHIWNIFSPLAGYLVEDLNILASCSIYVWGLFIHSFCLGELPEVAKTWIS